MTKKKSTEMFSVEKHPEFDKSIKSRLKANAPSQPKEKKPAPTPVESQQSTTVKEEGEDFSLGLFAQAEASTDSSQTGITLYLICHNKDAINVQCNIFSIIYFYSPHSWHIFFLFLTYSWYKTKRRCPNFWIYPLSVDRKVS